MIEVLAHFVAGVCKLKLQVTENMCTSVDGQNQKVIFKTLYVVCDDFDPFVSAQYMQ